MLNAGHLALHCGKYLHAAMFHMVVCQMRMCYIKSSEMDLFAFLNLFSQSPTLIACKWFCGLVRPFLLLSVTCIVMSHLIREIPNFHNNTSYSSVLLCITVTTDVFLCLIIFLTAAFKESDCEIMIYILPLIIWHITEQHDTSLVQPLISGMHDSSNPCILMAEILNTCCCCNVVAVML